MQVRAAVSGFSLDEYRYGQHDGKVRDKFPDLKLVSGLLRTLTLVTGTS